MDMNTPVKLEMLEVKPPPPNEKLIALVRDLLAGAESGRIQCLAAVWGDIDPERGRNAWCEYRGDMGMWALVGGLETIKHKILLDAYAPSNAGEGDS